MRGVWRPFVLTGGIALAVLLVTGGLRRLDGPGYLLMAYAVLLFAGGFGAVTFLSAGRFVKGLREGGLEVEVVEDEVGWWFTRRLHVRTLVGAWRVESELNGRSVQLHAKGPRDAVRVSIRGNARKAGRRAAERALAPVLEEDAEAPRGPTQPVWLRDPVNRRLVRWAILLAGPAAVLAGAWGLAAEAPWTLSWTILFWAGAGLLGFVGTVGGFSWAWHRWTHRAEDLGRRWGSGVLLVGITAGVGAVEAAWAVRSGLRGALPVEVVPAVGFAAAAFLLAAFALQAASGVLQRVVLSVAALSAGGSAVFLPSRFIGLVVGALAFGSFLLAWAPGGSDADAE